MTELQQQTGETSGESFAVVWTSHCENPQDESGAAVVLGLFTSQSKHQSEAGTLSASVYTVFMTPDSSVSFLLCPLLKTSRGDRVDPEQRRFLPPKELFSSVLVGTDPRILGPLDPGRLGLALVTAVVPGFLAAVVGKLLKQWTAASVLRELTRRKIEQQVNVWIFSLRTHSSSQCPSAALT
ncbi:uncharacterized protein V6R79_002584 [Siganus canaliculatus]